MLLIGKKKKVIIKIDLFISHNTFITYMLMDGAINNNLERIKLN